MTVKQKIELVPQSQSPNTSSQNDNNPIEPSYVNIKKEPANKASGDIDLNKKEAQAAREVSDKDDEKATDTNSHDQGPGVGGD